MISKISQIQHVIQKKKKNGVPVRRGFAISNEALMACGFLFYLYLCDKKN